MDKLKKIKILLETSKNFRKAPEKELYNSAGLCLYLTHEFNLNSDEIKEILGDKYDKKSFTLAGGYSQDWIYKNNLSDLKYIRANWCIDRALELLDGKKELTFVKFLKQQGVYERFLNNTKPENQRWSNIDSYYDNLADIKNISTKNWIISAFNWKATDEGYEFWDKISNMWINVITQYPDIKWE